MCPLCAIQACKNSQTSRFLNKKEGFDKIKVLKSRKINGNSIKNTTFAPQQLSDNCFAK